MAVAEIQQALTGEYTASQAYSFEFRDKNGTTITEIFFLLPPDSVNVQETQRSEIMPTLGGGYIADFGNDFKKISVSGQIHFFYAGTQGGIRPPGRTATVGTNPFVTGYEEFVKLRYLLMRYRDYTLTKNGKAKAPFFFNPELAPSEALKQHVAKQIARKKGALANEIEMVWHDYDYDDHWLVKIDDMGMTRTAKDVWTVMYDFSMIGYRQDPRRSSQQVTRTLSRRTPLLEKINKITIAMNGQHPESDPGTLTVQLQDTTFQLTNQVSIKNPPITVVLPQ